MPGPTTTSQSVASFDPRSIGGCQLWLDALDTSSITGSSTVTAWRDKSINVTSATNVKTPTLTASAINGRQAIFLSGSGSLLTGTSTGSGTTLTVCIVGTQSNGCATNGGLVCLGRSGQLDYADAGSVAITQISSGNMVSTRNSVNSQTTNTGLETPFIYIVIYDGTYVNTYYNGALQSTSNISISGTFAYTNYVIGNRAGSTSNVFWTGYIGEVLIFSQAFTAAQRLPIEGYLASKWGITLSSSTHPFYSVIPFTRTFSPTDIMTPYFWFDAADITTITGTTTVTAWANKGSWSGTATSYSGTVVSGSKKYNGLNTLVFPTNGELRFTAAIPLQPRAWFAVFNQTSQVSVSGPNYTQYFAIINQTQGSGQDSLFGPGIPTNTGTNSYVMAEGPSGNPNGVQTGNLVPNGYNTLKQYGWINSATSTASNFQTVNGTDYLTAGTPTANYTATAYRTDSVTYSINTDWYNNSCDCCEIILFNSEITVLQRQQIEGYLAWKWGIQSLLISGHPFNKFPPSTVASNIITANLLLNLDPLYGVSSTSWVPSVGNTWTFSSATTPVSTGPSKALSFSAQYVMDQTGISTGPANSSSFTIEIWFSAAGSVSGNLMAEMGQAGVPYSGWNVSMMYITSNTIYAAFWIGSVYSLSLGAYTANRWTQAVYTYSGTTVTGYVDGVYVSTGTATKQDPGTGFYCVAGGGNPYSGNTTCSIGGVKIYSADLTADQIKQNYNANAWRFKKPYI